MSPKKHRCSLDLGSDSMLPMAPTPSVLFRSLHKTFLISQHHPATYQHFRSYPTVIAERQRQFSEGGAYIIHPFSCFSLTWDCVMSVICITHMVVSSLRLCYVLPPIDGPNVHATDHLLLALHLACLVDVAVRFQIGYLERKGGGHVFLDRPSIAWHYIRSWFLVDVISSLPISYGLLQFGVSDLKYLLIAHILPNLKALRICKDINNIIRIIKIYRVSYVFYGSVRNIMFFVISVHWCSCMIYVTHVFNYYWSGDTFKIYNSFLNSTDLESFSIAHRYRRSIFICLCAFMGSGFPIFDVLLPVELMIHVLLILFAALFMIYTMVNLIKIYFTKYYSVIRYNELMNQLEHFNQIKSKIKQTFTQEYMRQKQFPAPLKKRVSTFYFYHYQGNYFREDLAFDTLSEQLRNEIILHTCHKLVDKVGLFEGLPASVVGSVLACLRAEVYLPNDLVVRAGDIGDCMYFIANGTVAVYSLKGVEVCHLEDGAHFGEVALLMKDSKRVASVVAVEITQVYRLGAEDFRHFIMSSQVLYERIEVLASQRMHETVLLDEAFRHDREKLKNLYSGHGLQKSNLKH